MSNPEPLSSAWPSHPELQAQELSELLDAVKALIVPFVQAGTHVGPAGTAPASQASKSDFSLDAGVNGTESAHISEPSSKTRGLVDIYPPEELSRLLKLNLPDGDGVGKDGLLELVQKTLDYSVNTWDQGFMDKLYNSTNAVGVISELLLAVLNTNAHVYAVSPFLTLIEKHVTARLASLIGFPASSSGGIAQPGGSASNSSSIVIARNTLYPETKKSGISTHRFTLFTSAHGHYSIEKAAQCFGFGSESVIPVPVDSEGRMRPDELDRLVSESKSRGETPFYVNATAGTTVLGSFDPFEGISAVSRKHGMWMHIDGSWGGGVLFSEKYRASRLKGAELADSMAVTPHKQLAVPVTSSFLIVRDMKNTHAAMTLPAGYLFHQTNSEEIYDLAELTPQCGRKGDALKLYLSWAYYGTAHLGRAIEQGYTRANYLLSLLRTPANAGYFHIVSPDELPCWQVCFYYVPAASNPTAGGDGEVGTGNAVQFGKVDDRSNEENTKLTASIVHGLVKKGFMVDYAPGAYGKHFRVVVHPHKTETTLELLVKGILDLGAEHA